MSELEQTSRRLELATRAARIAIWEWDFGTESLYWSPAFLEILGLEPDAFGGGLSDFMDRVVPEDRGRVQEAFTAHLESGVPYDVQYEMVHSNGKRITISATGQVAFDESGKPSRMLGTVQDVSDQLALERKLLLAESIGRIGHWELMVPENKLTWSPETFRIHGLDPNDAQPTVEEAFGFYHPEDVERVATGFEEFFKTGQRRGVLARLKLRDGDVRHVYADGISAETDEAGIPVKLFGIIHDRTEFVKKEEELRRSQRLEAVGQLAGGIAHDFNNLLAVIMGNLELLLEDEATRDIPESERRDILTSAISATRRGADLTRNILAFASKSQLVPKRVLLDELVAETDSWLSRMIPSTIRIETRLSEKAPPCLLDPAGFQSALVNVVVNARDAMPDGGKLTIETRLEDLHDRGPDTQDGHRDPVTYCAVTVSDTGRGIEPDLLERVFEPFVSTKGPASGSGLGLSMVQGFAHQSGGFVQIESTVGQGTCVRMYFPIHEGSDEHENVEVAEPHEPKGAPKKQRILIVEDQLEVLSVLVRILRSAGYDLEPATSGDQAYEVFREKGPFDLLLSDIVMPGGKSGPELAKACRELDPDLPVVFMSGYASEAVMHGELLPGDIKLMKPVAKAELLRALMATHPTDGTL